MIVSCIVSKVSFKVSRFKHFDSDLFYSRIFFKCFSQITYNYLKCAIFQFVNIFCRVNHLVKVIKVHIFWGGHKILRNIHLTFVLTSVSKKRWHICYCVTNFWNRRYVVPVKSKVEISQNFVAFSEYMNFNFTIFASKGHQYLRNYCSYIFYVIKGCQPDLVLFLESI